MKLAILNLTGGGISGGHKKYLLNMLPRLAASDEVEKILCASPGSLGTSDWLPAIPKVYCAACEPFRPFRHVPGDKLRALLDAFSPDLLFVPIERYMDYKKLPVVVMLQNMAPLTGVKTGTGLRELLVAAVRRYETKLALERAASIIVPTEFVKDFLVTKCGLPAGKITAVHYGYNPASASARPPASFPFAGKEFVFTAGSLESYRGIEDLILALPALKEKHTGIKLAVAGGSRPATEKYLSRLRGLAADLNVSGDIAWLGSLPEEELSWCYSNCSAFALTSRMESFCFVALEALAHGCNIVSTDSACLPEIFQDIALYYKPGDEKGLSAALLALLSRNGAQRLAKGSSAAARAGTFSWDAAAAATLDVLKRAVHPM